MSRLMQTRSFHEILPRSEPERDERLAEDALRLVHFPLVIASSAIGYGRTHLPAHQPTKNELKVALIAIQEQEAKIH